MNKISIIIPVYNVNGYLKRCVNSVLAECERLTEYEILLIDDGSTDESGVLCDEFAKANSCISTYHKQNGGLSDARNYGTLRATGEYVFYLDSDDYLVQGGLIALINEAENNNSDIIIGNFYYQYSDHRDLFDVQSYDVLLFKGGEQSLEALIDGVHYQNFAWGKLIRTDIAKKNSFPLGKLFEDTYWFHLILDNANQVSVLNRPVVYYVQRSGSISFDYKLSSLDILDGYSKRLSYFYSKYPLLVQKQMKLMVNSCISSAWMVCRYLSAESKNKGILKIQNIITENNLYKCTILNARDKQLLFLIRKNRILFSLFYIAYKLFSKISIDNE